MVLPLVDEANPKCCVCHEGFGSIEELRAHQKAKHEEYGSPEKRESAPGDVAVF